MKPGTLICAEGISCRVGLHEVLHPCSLSISQGEVWAIAGPNGSGKTVLSEILAGARAPSTGTIDHGPGIAERAEVLSFERQLSLIAHERRTDETWLLNGRTDTGTTVRDYLTRNGHELADELIAEFRMGHILDRGLRFLSTGEFRKTLLVGALMAGPSILVLDDPFDGLDMEARTELRQLVSTLPSRGIPVLFVAGHQSDLTGSVTHVAFLENGQLRSAGPRAEFDARMRDADRATTPANPAGHRRGGQPRGRPDGPGVTHDSIPGDWFAPPLSGPTIEMHDVTVGYGSTPVLDRITWTVSAGENWQIAGPNGAGKTTLLSLVTGTNPKAYGQDISLFGRRRGSGESVWDIKQKIGVVSGDFHHAYPARVRVLDAVLSGFTDSAGFFEAASGHQLEIARQWLRLLRLEGRADIRLRELSYGLQRAVLVARAMVKLPPLLIADEPCQGLDDSYTRLVLSLLDRIGAETPTTILYVSHNPDHTLDSVRRRLTLIPDGRGSRGEAT